MNYKLVIWGIISSFLLVLCTAALLGVGIVGRLLFTPQEKAQRIQVASVAPLLPPVVYSTGQQVVSDPPGLIAASLEEPPATVTPPPIPSPTSTPGPTPTLSPTPMPTPSQAGIATRLVIPKIDLDRPVLFAPVKNGTWQVEHLEQAVGHLEGTAPPGVDSNLVLAGHVTLDTGVDGPFTRLNEVANGDIVIVYEGDKKYFYLVESQRTVKQSDVAVVYPSGRGEITLITCTDWNNEERRYSNRLVVKGRLIKG